MPGHGRVDMLIFLLDILLSLAWVYLYYWLASPTFELWKDILFSVICLAGLWFIWRPKPYGHEPSPESAGFDWASVFSDFVDSLLDSD